jgi:glycosyltransferase involved in cell wall biosynthesis
MRVTCLINHYNYGEFLLEALDSVLAQTRVPDEVIVVDDGSAPEHLEFVRRVGRSSERVRIVEKSNGGQASCFEAGFAEATGDIVFFLDADDRWLPDYVAAVVGVFAMRPDVDFVATGRVLFDREGMRDGTRKESRYRGHSVVLCLESGGAWMGETTSCLAIRRQVLARIFPLPNPSGWRVCADEALVYGSSMVGARKYFLGEPLVEYRVHGDNAWYGKRDSPERAFSRRLEGRRLTEALRLRMSLPASLADMAHYEFRTIERPTRSEYRAYQRLVLRSTISWRRKLRVWSGIFFTYRLAPLRGRKK